MGSTFVIINPEVYRGLLLVGCLFAGSLAGPVIASGVGKEKGMPTSSLMLSDASTGSPAFGFDVNRSEPQQPAVLQIKGAISHDDGDEATLDMGLLQSLEPHSISTSTVVTDGIRKFDGVLMRAVLDYVGARGSTVTATALNGYEVTIPVRDFTDFDVLLAWAMDGNHLDEDGKGPFWIVYPRDQHDILQDIRYDYRWVWQLKSLRVH